MVLILCSVVAMQRGRQWPKCGSCSQPSRVMAEKRAKREVSKEARKKVTISARALVSSRSVNFWNCVAALEQIISHSSIFAVSSLVVVD